MRSFVRSLLLIAAVSTPLAALAYGNDEVQFDTAWQMNGDSCAGGAHPSHHPSDASHHARRGAMRETTRTASPAATRTATGDKLQQALAGQNGWATSFDSP